MSFALWTRHLRQNPILKIAPKSNPQNCVKNPILKIAPKSNPQNCAKIQSSKLRQNPILKIREQLTFSLRF
jgi:hypothetical protein